MHIVMMVVIGLVALGIFYFGAGIRGLTREQGAVVFLWVWFVSSAINGLFGIFSAGIPVINEIGAFVPIFGIPAAAAWYLAYHRGA